MCMDFFKELPYCENPEAQTADSAVATTEIFQNTNLSTPKMFLYTNFTL